MADESVTFELDGREVTARKGELVIAAAERAGTFIPRFCYHPRMEAVGMCRMCLVEIDSPRGPTLQPACYVPVADQMKVTTDSDRVKKAQDGVLEFLLVNHPLDCPVCDKGGECPLQDQTLAHGPGDTRFLEEKRHFEKPIALSDLVLLDRERCIQCARCTRFAAEIAGEAQIDFAGRGERVEVATFPTQRFTSHYSGNTVQICPVGALTASPYRFLARPWDLDQLESTCTTCAVGCRVAVQASANRVTRMLGVDSEPVNHGWLCDKGRFAYEATNGPEPDEPELPARSPRRRLTTPLVRRDGELVEATWGEAIEAAASAIRRAASTSPEGVGAIGGAALTNEGQYAWARFLKGVVGTDNVDAQLGDGLDPMLVAALPRATIADATSARCVVLLTGNLDHELPVLYLRLRAAALRGTPLVELAEAPSSLSPLCAASVRVRPGDAPAAVAALLGDDAAATRLLAHGGPQASAAQLAAARAALAAAGEDTVIVLGRPNLAEDASVIEDAARRLLAGLPKARFLLALRRSNVAGALDVGLAPGVLPGRVGLDAGRAYFAERWGRVPARRGRDTLAQLRALVAREQRALLVLGADPFADVLDAPLTRTALEVAEDVIVVSGHDGPLLEHATVVLPATVAHERPGTTTNIEGRVTRLGQLVVAPGLAWHDTDIAAELAAAFGVAAEADAEALTDEIAEVSGLHRTATSRALAAAADGVVLDRGPSSPRLALDPIAFPGVQPVESAGFHLPAGAIAEPAASATATATPARVAVSDVLERRDTTPSAPAPDAYSLRLVAERRLYDRGAAIEASPSLLALVEVATARANPYDLDRIGAGDGRNVRLRSERGAAVVRCVADPTVARGTLCVGMNLDVPGQDRVAAILANPDAVVTEVRMESL